MLTAERPGTDSQTDPGDLRAAGRAPPIRSKLERGGCRTSTPKDAEEFLRLDSLLEGGGGQTPIWLTGAHWPIKRIISRNYRFRSQKAFRLTAEPTAPLA